MDARFSPKLDILPPAQRRLWDELGGTPRHFVLYGGTALALHLGHRQSVDFDFFSREHFDPAKLAASIPYLNGARLSLEENTVNARVDRQGEVRVSLFGGLKLQPLTPPSDLAPPGIQVASITDIAATKLATVQSRSEAKDYLDLHAILAGGHLDLPHALAAARAAYGQQFNAYASLRALTYYDDGNLATVPPGVRLDLVRASAAVDLNHLPSFERGATTIEAPEAGL